MLHVRQFMQNVKLDVFCFCFCFLDVDHLFCLPTIWVANVLYKECLPGVKNLFLEKIKDYFLLQWESAAVEWRVLLRESEKSNVWWCQQKLLSKWPFTINLLKTFIPFRKLFQVQKAFQYIDETVTMSISNLINVDYLVYFCHPEVELATSIGLGLCRTERGRLCW